MEVKLKNKYFILRHGESTHQIEKPDIVYHWPEDNPPAPLTKKGESQIKEATQYLKNKKIDLIFSSDSLRTRQTAKIVAKELGLEIKQDFRLRDVNWGIYQGKPMREAWSYYKHNREEKFKRAPPGGETWLEIKERVIDFIKEVEGHFNGKTILIVSHGDPLWLLEGWFRGLSNKELLNQKRGYTYIKIGELRELN